MQNDYTKQWNASDFFRRLTETNLLAQKHGFKFAEVSGLQGLEEAVSSMQNTRNFVCVMENAAGYTEMDNSPHIRRVRTVFLVMRHVLGDMKDRRRCMDIITELHRQFCSMLIREKTRLEDEHMQYLDSRINLQEASKYLIPGTVIFMFELAVDTYVSFEYNEKEWSTQPNS